jgi:hypothetical protein
LFAFSSFDFDAPSISFPHVIQSEANSIKRSLRQRG